MQVAVFALIICCLAMQVQISLMRRRLMDCEHDRAALDILAEQVCELQGDFYGPEPRE